LVLFLCLLRNHYSTNAGAFGSTFSGSSVQFRSKGTYIVQFRAVDRVGTTSAWDPLVAGAANTACHS
jgi:hypothetical protein